MQNIRGGYIVVVLLLIWFTEIIDSQNSLCPVCKDQATVPPYCYYKYLGIMKITNPQTKYFWSLNTTIIYYRYDHEIDSSNFRITVSCTSQADGTPAIPIIFISMCKGPVINSYDYVQFNSGNLSTISLDVPSPSRKDPWYIGFTLKQGYTQTCGYWVDLDDNCFNNCSSHGVCTPQGCICNTPYLLPDCATAMTNLTFNTPLQATISTNEMQYYNLQMPKDNLPHHLVFNHTTLSQNYPQISSKKLSQISSPQTQTFPFFLRKNQNPTLLEYDYVCNSSDLSNPCVLDVYEYPANWVIGVWGVVDRNYVLLVQNYFSCPRNCSGQGNCINGTCFCNTYYQGSACELYLRVMNNSDNFPETIIGNTWKYYQFNSSRDIMFQLSVFESVVPIQMYVNYNSRPNYHSSVRVLSCTSDISPCIMELDGVTAGIWYLGIYYNTTSDQTGSFSVGGNSTTLCPNYCNFHGKCSLGLCSCSDSYTLTDCSKRVASLPLYSGKANWTLDIPANYWWYYKVYNITPTAYFFVQVYNVYNPVNIYFRFNSEPNTLTYDATIDLSLIDTGNIAQSYNYSLALMGITKPVDVLYIGFQSPVPQSFKSFFNIYPKTCTLPCPKTGGQILPLQLYTGTVYLTEWVYYWFIAPNDSPLTFALEEKLTSEDGYQYNKGLLWMFVRKTDVPTLLKSDYWNTSVSQLHTIHISSGTYPSFPILWSIGITTSPLLQPFQSVAYSLIVSSTCDGYFDIEPCIQDPQCIWCLNRWEDNSGICINHKSTMDSCLQTIDDGDIIDSFETYQNRGKLSGVGVIIFVVVCCIVGGIYTFSKRNKNIRTPIVSYSRINTSVKRSDGSFDHINTELSHTYNEEQSHQFTLSSPVEGPHPSPSPSLLEKYVISPDMAKIHQDEVPSSRIVSKLVGPVVSIEDPENNVLSAGEEYDDWDEYTRDLLRKSGNKPNSPKSSNPSFRKKNPFSDDSD